MPEAHDSVGSNPTVATNIHGEIGKLAKPKVLGTFVCGFDSRSRYHLVRVAERQTPYVQTIRGESPCGFNSHRGHHPVDLI